MSNAISVLVESTNAQTPAQTDLVEQSPIALSLDDALHNLEDYRTRPVKGFDVLRDNTDLCADPRVAAVFVECALAADRVDLAELVLPMAQDGSGILAAMTFTAKNQTKRALDALKSIPSDGRHQAYAFGLMVKGNIKARRYDAASKAVYNWSLVLPSSPQPFRVMGKALAEKGDARAERWLQRAINISSGGSGAVLDMAAFLISQGRADEARAHLDTLKYVSGRTKRRKQRLLRAL